MWAFHCQSPVESCKLSTTGVFTYQPGGSFNMRMSYRYRDSYCKDKTTSRLSYFYNGNTFTWKDGVYIETGPWKLRLSQKQRHFGLVFVSIRHVWDKTAEMCVNFVPRKLQHQRKLSRHYCVMPKFFTRSSYPLYYQKHQSDPSAPFTAL